MKKRHIVPNMVALGIFAVVAVVILFQLYNVLGRKVGFRAEEKPAGNRPDDLDMTPRIDKPAESRLPNLEALKTRDSNFNEINFLEKARETYEQIVVAFHKGEIDTIKDKLAEPVLASFRTAISSRASAPVDTVSFVDAPKADLDVIDFQDDVAQIRVRFLSELAYETPPANEVLGETLAPVETLEDGNAAPSGLPVVDAEKVTLDKAPKNVAATSTQTAPKQGAPSKDAPKPHKTYKRTAEYWTFQKALRTQNSPWLLTKVEAAKA